MEFYAVLQHFSVINFTKICPINKIMEIFVNDTLTWQRSSRPDVQHLDPPVPLLECIPDWFKRLKTDLKLYKPDGFSYDQTARQCLGLRGAMGVGYTIPWQPKNLMRSRPLHAEQLHGSRWAIPNPDGQQWVISIISYPWRAKMPPGWSIMINSHPLNWSQDWFTFTGIVDYATLTPNNDCEIGSLWSYDHVLDSNYHYYNIETVMAFRNLGVQIPVGTPVFSIVPIYVKPN